MPSEFRKQVVHIVIMVLVAAMLLIGLTVLTLVL